MNSQAELWLYPLILVAAFSLIVYIRMGVSWTWGFCLQSLLMLSAGIGGLVTGQHVFCSSLGWALFLLFVLVPRTILSKLERSLNQLDPQNACAAAAKLRWFFWGPPGRYWPDLAEAMKDFLEGDTANAEALIEKWQKTTLPRQTRDGLSGYQMTGRILVRDWPGIIAELQRLKLDPAAKATTSIATAACRAYLELNRVPEACLCLKAANLPGSKMSEAGREISFVTFFSLSGAEAELESIFEKLTGSKDDLPQYARLYWLARCRAAQGKIAQCKELLAKALQLTPSSLKAWQKRITYQLERLTDAPDLIPHTDHSAEIEQAKAVLAQARLVANVISPKRSGLAVIVIAALIAAVYLVSHSFEFIQTPQAVELSSWCLRWGGLYKPAVEHGEYWRLVTFQFLHAHISHLALNLVGLWWFGRMVENLFGTRNFLVIWLLSGIMSGISEVLWSQSLMSIGASGSVMGVFGAATGAIFRCKDLLPANIRRNELSWMFKLALLQVILDQIVPHVAVFAHLGGLVSGLILGLLLPVRKDYLLARAQLKPEVSVNAAGISNS
jgi:rhomboid protease GluP